MGFVNNKIKKLKEIQEKMIKHEQQTRRLENFSDFFRVSNFSRLNLYKTAILMLLIGCPMSYSFSTETKPYHFNTASGGIIFNEDNNHFFSEDIPVTRKAIVEYIDKYLYPGHQIREFFICVNAARASFPSKVFPPMWDGIEFKKDGTAYYLGKIVKNAGRLKTAAKLKELETAGIDPFKLWIEHLRKSGVSPWMSMRMNDIHEATDAYSIHHSKFWLDHPEWRIAPYSKDGCDHALDYGVPEVRKYNLAMAIEIIERYDADGLELDWMRWGRVFRHGEEQKNAHLLTSMLRQIRTRANELERNRGHRIKLAVRVPQDPRDTQRMGYDVETWAREGLIDILTVSPFFHSTWDAVPVSEWRRIIGDKVLLSICIEANKSPFARYPTAGYGLSGEITNGLAANYFYNGADRIYLFNHFWRPKDILTTSGAPESVNRATRRCYLSYNDFPAVGIPKVYRLPVSVGYDWMQSFRINVGQAPAPTQKAIVMIANRSQKYVLDDMLTIRINGALCKRTSVLPNVKFNVNNAYVAGFEIPSKVLHDGENVIDITNSSKEKVLIEWLEIYINELSPPGGM